MRWCVLGADASPAIGKFEEFVVIVVNAVNITFFVVFFCFFLFFLLLLLPLPRSTEDDANEDDRQ